MDRSDNDVVEPLVRILRDQVVGAARAVVQLVGIVARAADQEILTVAAVQRVIAGFAI